MKKMIVNRVNGDFKLVETSTVKSFRKAGIRYNEHGIAVNRIVITCDIGTILEERKIDVLINTNIKKFVEKGHIIHSEEMENVVRKSIQEHLEK
ncbi:MAG: hypothetical protein ACRC92_11405 [Peptostreptococcaceae bacterium]